MHTSRSALIVVIVGVVGLLESRKELLAWACCPSLPSPISLSPCTLDSSKSCIQSRYRTLTIQFFHLVTRISRPQAFVYFLSLNPPLPFQLKGSTTTVGRPNPAGARLTLLLNAVFLLSLSILPTLTLPSKLPRTLGLVKLAWSTNLTISWPAHFDFEI
jgi:hypothetical protein